MTQLETLAARWLADADVLDGALDSRGASLYRRHAAELQEALRVSADEVLTLTQASSESGYSESRLRHLLADGSLPQAGERGRPRVRRGDLPSKAAKAPRNDVEAGISALMGS